MQHIRRQSIAAGALRSETRAHALVDEMVDTHKRPGRFAKRGWYEYDDNGARLRLWPELASLATAAGRAIPIEDLKERMLFIEAIESLKCRTEGVLRSEADANVGSILGIGYPAWTGGVLRYVTQFDGGARGFEARAAELAEAYGDRFQLRL